MAVQGRMMHGVRVACSPRGEHVRALLGHASHRMDMPVLRPDTRRR